MVAPSAVEPDFRTGGSDQLAATILSDALADGPDRALANLVVEYVGKRGKARLRRRRRHPNDCQEIADAARSLAEIGKASHQMAGKAVGALLPPGTPPLVRDLTEKIVARAPLGWDDSIKTIVHGLQATGIFLCMVQLLPPEACPCLHMLTHEVTEDAVKGAVEDLVAEARRDLEPRQGAA
ncbi:hypothetical protein [Asanoa sp. NPDC050611]|uniref:hypothetical protein n=1 Tax=Asanoa sp. NPDC050611 TaxID=3157098 RepID=UPI0033D14429